MVFFLSLFSRCVFRVGEKYTIRVIRRGVRARINYGWQAVSQLRIHRSLHLSPVILATTSNRHKVCASVCVCLQRLIQSRLLRSDVKLLSLETRGGVARPLATFPK